MWLLDGVQWNNVGGSTQVYMKIPAAPQVQTCLHYMIPSDQKQSIERKAKVDIYLAWKMRRWRASWHSCMPQISPNLPPYLISVHSIHTAGAEAAALHCATDREVWLAQTRAPATDTKKKSHHSDSHGFQHFFEEIMRKHCQRHNFWHQSWIAAQKNDIQAW